MNIKFSKYQGTGNDFIIINNLSNFFPKDDNKLISVLCNRKFGIGADGLILINKHSSLPFEMNYYNSDGFIGSMCGNGARCSVHFSFINKIIKSKTKFNAFDGIHSGIVDHDIINISMSDVIGFEKYEDYLFIDTGSPHLVKIVQDVNSIDLINVSQKIQQSKHFKEGVNVNFISKNSDNSFETRTYERGVEDETLSCGTGAVAAAIALNILSLEDSNEINLKTKGGLLNVNFRKSNNKYTDIYLSGKVKKVFDGVIKV